MIKNLPARHRYVRQQLALAWVLFTLSLMASVAFYEWRYTYVAKLTHFKEQATQFTTVFDNLIKNIRLSVMTLPNYSHSKEGCKTILPQLRSILFNNFYMAGIVISDANHAVLCSTLPSTRAILPSRLPQNPTLTGPIQLNKNTQPVFLLQQPSGDYYLGIYLVKPLFNTLFKNIGSQFDFIGLYDTSQKNMLFYKGDIQSVDVKHNRLKTTLILPVQLFDTLRLVISVKPFEVFHDVILNVLLSITLLIFLSWLLYQYGQTILQHHFSMTYALQKALDKHQFYPVYQPIYDESRQCFCGAEVLIRWQTAFNETIMPDYFIYDAEKSGLIVPITLELIETAFQECQHLLIKRPDMYLSFNLSPAHFRDADFFRLFYDLCHYYQIKASQIMLELTERELFNDSDDSVVVRMNELRQAGYALTLDDFGTGRANINYLQHFPFNYLKIDKLFISTIGTGAITEQLNLGIIAMANSLGLRIIAEGVETREQLDYLRMHQVVYIQGWFYAKAMPYSQLTTFMAP